MRKSLRIRLTVYFVALVMIPLLLVGAIGTWQTYNTQVTQALEAQGQVAKRVSEQVSHFIQSRESELRALTGVRGLGSASLTEQTNLLSSLFSQQSEYEELVLVNSRGRELVYLSRTRLITAQDLGSRVGADEFEKPKETGNEYFGNVVFDEATGEPSMSISIPMFNLQTGSLTHVLIAKIRFKAVWDIMARADVIGSGIVYMTDNENFVVAHANPSVVLQRTNIKLPVSNSFTTGLGNNNVAMAIEKIAFGEQTFFIVAEQPASEALALAVNNIILTLGATLFAIVLAGFLGVLAARQITDPIGDLAQTAQLISEGDLTQTPKVTSEDEIGALAKAFNKMTEQLREIIASLESRVAERTRNLELAAEVGRSVSQVRALNEMLTDAAEIIRAQFDLYYVQVYLVDASQTNLVLQSGTGAVGKELIERRHRLPIGTASINGRAALEKNPVVISDTTSSLLFKPNPLLPETRSEMAVPLMIGDQVVGVLDMQSARANALSQDALPAFQALAGQLAIAIQNANFLAETEKARAEVESQARRLARAGWQDYLDAIHRPEQTGFVFEQDQVLPLEADIMPPAEPGTLAASIALTGEQVGALMVEVEPERQTPQAVELVNVVARQVAQQIENLRLLETAERYRFEAEQAARRLTREGWKEYFHAKADQSIGYLYDLREVKPSEPESALETESALAVPIKVRDETIGKLAIFDLDAADPETLDLINTVSERLAEHIESLRLFDQTQIALSQTERLSAASLRFAQAADLQELVKIAVETLAIPGINRALLDSLTFNAANEMEKLTVLASWWSGSGHEPTAVGTSLSTETMKALSLFAGKEPVFFSDAFNDPRIDPATLEFLKQRNIRAVASLPLFTGAQQIGALLLESEEPHTFLDDEIRLFTAMGPQIATVLENRRQFERAQRQAEREAMLNAISQKIQSATSVEAVLQIAARELGHALGAPRAIAQLSMKDAR